MRSVPGRAIGWRCADGAERTRVGLPDGPGRGTVGLEQAEDALQRRALLYDRQADRHYDTISAWIKATRGSDPDASLYYLAVMLEGGEDPRFIVRRMVVLASEDIGNADPQALAVATAAAAAVEHVGMPEAGSLWLRRPSTCRWRRSPMRPSGRWAPRAGSSASTARRRLRRTCARPPAATGTTTIHMPARAHLATGAHARSRDRERFYEPDDAEAALRERLEEIRRARGRS